MTASRIRTLFRKELIEAIRNRAALAPVAVVTVISIVLPFLIALIVPAMTGQHLSDDRDLLRVSAAAGAHAGVSLEGQVQVFLFQEFLLLFLLMPITGAMALAAHAIVGEKLARTLEPLLATPVTTFELLVAKVLGALVPTLAISLAALAVYFGGIAAFAEPGVTWAMMTPRTLVLVLLVGPAAALVALQAAVVISSRVNDARTAQQFGVLIVLPLTAALVAQFTGAMWLSTRVLALVGAGLLALWGLLTLASVALFEREAILTKWR